MLQHTLNGLDMPLTKKWEAFLAKVSIIIVKCTNLCFHVSSNFILFLIVFRLIILFSCKIGCTRSISVLGMALILPLRGFEMLMLLLYRIELLFSFLTCCKLGCSPRGKQALGVSFLCGTFRFWTRTVSIELLYSHVFLVFILLPDLIMPIVLTFIRVAFFDRELAEGAPSLTYQWLLMGTIGAMALFLLIWTSIFILLFPRASRISHLFNGLIADNWLFCLFCTRTARLSSRKFPRWWARARSSWPMVRVPRFRFALATSVLSYDRLMCWRHLALIVLIFTLIQIIIAGAVICILDLRRRNFLIVLSNWVRLLLISRLKQRATKVAWDKKAIVWFTVNSIARGAPFSIVCIIKIVAKTSMTLHAWRLRVLRELTRVGEVRHISRRAQTSLRLWVCKWAPRIRLILIKIVHLIVDV